MNIDIFIPVRLNSSRLPKKHLELIHGKHSLKHLLERLYFCKEIRHIVVCCTTEKSDDPLIDFLKHEKVLFFRGSEKDILKRFLDAAKQFSTDIIIDVEGDKIYTDPVYVDKIAFMLKNSQTDFIIGNDSKSKFNPSNHFIHGVVPAGFKTNSLEKICKLKQTSNTETGYREFFINNTFIKYEFLVIKSTDFTNKIRLTLDYPEDLELAKKIFGYLGTVFSTNDLLKLYREKPELILITEKIIEKWERNYEKTKTDISIG